ncbi:uncharacterized protein LOC143283677 [Babylonia areolata]|uniref:uncharacterized protein LOC143283677 n=1 Tax=Babylonia areolata TaxID=304850 RepID=UPI003FD3C248
MFLFSSLRLAVIFVGAAVGHNERHSGNGYNFPPGPDRFGIGYGGILPVVPQTLAPNEKKPLTELDEVYKQMEDIADQIKAHTEEVDALGARLSIEEKRAKELKLGQFLAMAEVDQLQNEALDELEEELTELEADAESLHVHLGELNTLNTGNTERQQQTELLRTQAQVVDLSQSRDVNRLHSTVLGLKDKLLQVQDNELETVSHSVEQTATTLHSIKDSQSRRMCEVGRVTLTPQTPRVEYHYQTDFRDVPQVTWGLCGFLFDLNSGDVSGKDPPGNSYILRGPGALGVHVQAYSTRTSVVLRAFEGSFGAISGLSTDVCFRACSKGPGIAPVKH